jgi:hypothetical protein
VQCTKRLDEIAELARAYGSADITEKFSQAAAVSIEFLSIAKSAWDRPPNSPSIDSSRATVGAEKIRHAIEIAGVEFIDENGGGPGAHLRKRQRSKKT